VTRSQRYRILYLLLALLLPGLSPAAGSGPEQMEHFLAELTTLQARFEQTVEGPDRNQPLRSSGIFYLRRPNQFRWDYSEPERQEIVADGRQIWFYDPELEQVSVQFQRKALRGTPAQLLASGDPVENSFRVRDGGERQGLEWVELIPHDSESQFERILLGFRDDRLQRMEMRDKFGQATRFRFFDIRENPEFKSTFFRFEPPEDVDLYNQ